MGSTLDIYIEKNCVNCEEAEQIASWVKERMPHISVRVIDLNGTEVEKPLAVFAVPTYLLNGERISLGNPDPVSLLKTLEDLKL